MRLTPGSRAPCALENNDSCPQSNWCSVLRCEKTSGFHLLLRLLCAMKILPTTLKCNATDQVCVNPACLSAVCDAVPQEPMAYQLPGKQQKSPGATAAGSRLQSPCNRMMRTH